MKPLAPPTAFKAPPKLTPPPALKPPVVAGGLKVGDFKYSINGIRYTVKMVNDEVFQVAEIPFARFDKKTGECDRYVHMRMFDSPQPIGQDIDTLMMDLASLMRHGKEWICRQMFGNEGFHYGATPLETARKAVMAARKRSGVLE